MNGQAKIDFLEYYYETKLKPLPMTICKKEDLGEFFDTITPIFQHALIIEWFDTIGIYIGIEVYRSPEFQIKYEGIVSTKSDDWYLQGQFSEIYSTRQQATEKAIEKAIILYNLKFKENE